MLYLSTIFFLTFSWLAATATLASPIKRQSTRCNPVRFNTVLPTYLCGGSTLDLAWEGGSGHYNVFRWDQDQKIYYLRNTGLLQVQFGWDEFYAYPEGKAFILGIESADDLSEECGGDFESEEMTGLMPVVHCETLG